MTIHVLLADEGNSVCLNAYIRLCEKASLSAEWRLLSEEAKDRGTDGNS